MVGISKKSVLLLLSS